MATKFLHVNCMEQCQEDSSRLGQLFCDRCSAEWSMERTIPGDLKTKSIKLEKVKCQEDKRRRTSRQRRERLRKRQRKTQTKRFTRKNQRDRCEWERQRDRERHRQTERKSQTEIDRSSWRVKKRHGLCQ